MRQLVNGEELALVDDPSIEISMQSDRMLVRTPEGTFSALALRAQGKTYVSFKGRVFEVSKPGARVRSGGPAGLSELRAPMPGSIVDVLVSDGDDVKKGQKLLVLEAMKTQQPILAGFDGKVRSIQVERGMQVSEGDLLISVDPLVEST